MLTTSKSLVSERGVVFLRDQDVTPTEMKDLMLRITELSGCVRSFTITTIPLFCFPPLSRPSYRTYIPI